MPVAPRSNFVKTPGPQGYAGVVVNRSTTVTHPVLLQGTQLSRINLVETSLALSDFTTAEQQLTILKEQDVDGFLDETFKNRVILLEVKLLFQQQRYNEALATIEPLQKQNST
jgi:hypothetical protein